MKGAGALLYLLSIALIATGFIFMFNYGDYNEDYNSYGSKFGHVVGGDAYNYIIIGVRGLAFMVTGLISAVAASTLFIVESINNKKVSVQIPEQTKESSVLETVQT